MCRNYINSNNIALNIAGMTIVVPASLNLPDSYKVFMSNYAHKMNLCLDSVICRMEPGSTDDVSADVLLESCSFEDGVKLSVFRCKDGKFISEVTFLNKGDGSTEVFRTVASKDWKYVVIDKKCCNGNCPASGIDKLVMMAFVYSAARHNTVLLHSSCVKTDKGGMAFIGFSGDGKSTHSQVWIKSFEGVSLLNDDQPAVRIMENGEVRIYGTPWSGKTPCYVQDSARLLGFARMVKAPFNRVTPYSPVFLFKELMEACSLMKKDKESMRIIMSTLSGIAAAVPGFMLENRPEREAAVMLARHIEGFNDIM